MEEEDDEYGIRGECQRLLCEVLGARCARGNKIGEIINL
jgi:hypothetical protein